jgi:hypothetical protein
MRDSRWRPIPALLTVLWLAAVACLIAVGWGYYRLPLEARPYSGWHLQLKPGGTWGHGLGIFGSVMMTAGVVLYMLRKRARWMMPMGNLRHWLTFHIFLCATGATLVTFHTAFKFGGLVAFSFWSMVGVAASGVLGRYVYVRVPRDIRGNALTAEAVRVQYEELSAKLRLFGLAEELLSEIDAVFGQPAVDQDGGESGTVLRMISDDFLRLFRIWRVRRLLKEHAGLPSGAVQQVLGLVRQRTALLRSIHFYTTVRQVLHYWHVIHLPFALVMFLIMLIHVATALLFGYRWVF